MSEKPLENNPSFNSLITRIATRFINLPPDKIDAGIQQALEEVGQLLGVDRSYLFRYSSDQTTMSNTHEWCRPGVEPQIQNLQDLPLSSLAWSNGILISGEVLHIPDVEALPPEAEAEKREFQQQNIQSLITVPMIYQEETIGFLGFDAVNQQRRWSEKDVQLLKMLSTIFANALALKRAQSIQYGQHQFLELLATGTDFSQILHTLIETIEEQWPGMQGLILLLDQDREHLHVGASGSLPQAYVESLEGLKIGPQAGSCGTACFCGERVVVEDITQDPRWEGLRDLALEHDLRACWSEPVLSPEGDVIGTFAMYYSHPRSPSKAELRTIDLGAHLVGIALERKHADEALKESRRRLSTLISNLPGMAYRCRNVPRWSMEFVSQGSLELTGYPPEALIDDTEISYGDMIHPEDRGRIWRMIQNNLENRTSYQISYRLITPGGEKWVWEQGQGVYDEKGNITALEGFITDISDRVNARMNLERRVEERTHELTTLLEISHNLASTLDLDHLLDLILDQLGSVVEYDAASIMTLEDDTLQIIAYRGPIAREEALRIAFSLDEARANQEVIQQGAPVIIADVRGEDPLAQSIRDTAGSELDSTYNYLRCWMGVPLIVKDKIVGMLTLDHKHPDFYTVLHADLSMAFANQAAVAIDNARLYQLEQERLEESEQRRKVAEGMRDVLAILNSNRSLDEILTHIAAQATQLTEADSSAIYQLNRKKKQVSILTHYHFPEAIREVQTFPLANIPARSNILQGKPFIMNEQASPDSPPEEHSKIAQLVQTYFRSSLIVPLTVKGEIYGALGLYYREPRPITGETVELAMSFSDQAALAIENAQLQSQVEQSAIAAERDRLARDLHDAVSQTLFSTSLIAEVLPRIWERDPEQGRQRLEEIRTLTRGALAEMRSLLVELRPSALIETSLPDLMQQLTDAFKGRTGLPVQLDIQGTCQLPPDVKVATYRVTQEALNNVAKHARASHCRVKVTCQTHQIEVRIQDDGQGFNFQTISPEHMGLGIMKDRAEQIDAEFDIISGVGQGTEVKLNWNDPEEVSHE
jgi:PAS domain S-box-containing protein